MSKENVIRTIESLAEATGHRTVAPNGMKLYGGHSYRQAGVKLYARGGISEPIIKAISRHESSAVEGYIAEVAAEGSAKVAAQMASASSSRPPVTAPMPAQVVEPWKSMRHYQPAISFVQNLTPAAAGKLHLVISPTACKCSYSPMAPFAEWLDILPSSISKHQVCKHCLPTLYSRLARAQQS